MNSSSLLFALLFSVAPLQGQQTAPADQEALKSLTKRLETLEAQRQADLTKLNLLVTASDEDAKGRAKLIMADLENSVDLLRGLHDKLLTIEGRIAADSLTTYISGLQSPTNQELGFNLREVVINSVRQLRLGRTQGSRAERIVNSIMDSPIYQSVASSSPVASALSSVLSLIRGVCFVDNTDTSKLETFEAEIGKYIAYYTVLDEGRVAFDFELKSQAVELQALHLKVSQQALEFAAVIGCKIEKQGSAELTSDFLNRVFQQLTRDSVESFFLEQEKRFTENSVVNYRALLSPKKDNVLLVASGVARSSAEMVEQLQARKKLLEEAHSKYCANVDKALTLAREKNIGRTDRIAAAQSELSRRKSESETAMRASLNFDILMELSRGIKRPK